MSWPDPKLSRRAALALLGSAALALGGCTITPVHGDRALTGANELALHYTSPNNRLEQVAYQALAARLGTSGAETSPIVTLSVSTSATRVGLTDFGRSATDHQLVATISYSVEEQGEIVSKGIRTATSGYRTTGQILADDTARQKADEDAIRAAAQSVIAALLSDSALR